MEFLAGSSPLKRPTQTSTNLFFFLLISAHAGPCDSFFILILSMFDPNLLGLTKMGLFRILCLTLGEYRSDATCIVLLAAKNLSHVKVTSTFP